MTTTWRCALGLALVLWMGSATAGTAQVVDSVSIRLRESLRRLERPPAPDTGAAADSLAVTPIQVISRPGRPQTRPATDSVMQAILGLAGYEATRYSGIAADYDAASKVLVLQGDSTHRASVERQGTQLTADSVIRYDEAKGLIRAEGLPLFSPAEGDPIQSRRVIYDVASQRGSAIGAKTKYSQGATWFVTGDLPSVTPTLVYGVHADFTSCELEVPHYHFSADQVKIVAGNILVARPVTLYFADVPVAYLPFFAQSLGTGRASGLLTPRFGVNEIVRTSGGYHRRVSNVGFYWAMSEYSDATLAMDWFSGNFTSLTGSFRYTWLRQFLNGDVNVRQYWRDEGGSELAFDTNHSWQMDERTNFRLAARYTSSSDFVRRNSFNPLEVTQSINSTGGFDRRYGWGNVSLSGNRDQYLSDDRVEMTLPTAQLNLATITLFRAPALRSRWYNNLTWSAGANGNRRILDRSLKAGESITAANRDLENLTGGFRSSLGLGRLSLSQTVNVDRASVFELPFGPVLSLGMSPSGRALLPAGASAAAIAATQALTDVNQTQLNWSTSLGYQQTLIGSTTLTPSLSLSGSARRSDTIDVARDHFVSAPRRLALGATFRSDLFGFFPGVGPFEAIRHKLSPGIDFSYAPSVTSTALQARLF
ncbi:MAG: LPS-assembly protein LptD, partial [Gemmatimonadetes bacterium]|nr:LPS-assembly protein LptD [Gemmatimonadota bacterium]